MSYGSKFMTAHLRKFATGGKYPEATVEMFARLRGEDELPVTPGNSTGRENQPGSPQFTTSALTHRISHSDVPSVRLIVSSDQMVDVMTRCLNDAPCPTGAKRIYRTLYAVALEIAASHGHAASVTRSVYHLPAELVMDHVGLKSSAFYANLIHLRRLGLVCCDAHMGNLRGKSVATGTLWVISLQPERILAKQAAPVRIRREDWERNWRDLNADAKAGNTAYNLLNPYTKTAAGQSRNRREERVSLGELKTWAKKPFVRVEPDILTVRPPSVAVLDAIWGLGDASMHPRHRRAAIVDRQAQVLASAFGDAAIGFWRRLIWNLTRGIDAGVDLTQQAGTILARVLGDVQHDLNADGTPPLCPAAVANAALADLRTHLQLFQDQPVGSRPSVT